VHHARGALAKASAHALAPEACIHVAVLPLRDSHPLRRYG
jgi:hypothetical protein